MNPQINTTDFNERPFVAIWEVTQACDLACVHCRASAQPDRNPMELSTDEGKHLINQIAALKVPVFVLTGGDPIKRPDLFDLIAHASSVEVRVSLTPSATPLLTKDVIIRLKEAGLTRLGVSMDGRAVSSRFIAVRAKAAGWSALALWGLLNSPVANAFVFSHLGKRDNTVGEIRQMPIPKPQDLQRLENSVKRYLLAASRQSDGSDLKELLLDVDCEVLRLYDLPVGLERNLLDIFANWDRVGVPFSQLDYIPGAFKVEVSLSTYRELAKNWERTNEERGTLIDQSIRGELDTEGRARLSLLQAYAEFHVFDVAPRPRHDIEALENELLSLAESEGRIVH